MTIASIGSMLFQSVRTQKRMLLVGGSIFSLFVLSEGLALGGNKYWVGNGTDTNAPGSGVWTTTTPVDWSDGTAAVANAGWNAGDTAYFGGTDGVYGVQVGGPISVTSLNFLASGYTLSNSPAQTITASDPAHFITVAAGKTNVIGSGITVTIGSSSPAAVGAPSGVAGGTLIIDNNGIVQQTVNRGLNVSGAAGTVVSVRPGGMLKQANTQAGSSYLTVGYKVGDAPTLSVDGGTVMVARTTQSIDVPAPAGVAAFGDVEGTLTVNSGSVIPGSAAGIVLAQEPLNTGTLNLNGGVITAAAGLTKGGTAPGDSTGIAHFNGGTLKAAMNQPVFIDGLDWADIRNGSLVVDNSGYSVTVGQSLAHSTNVTDNAVDGGVTGVGTGTLTLLPDNGGYNTYTGPTTVSNGTVVVTPANIGGGACYVNNGATLTVTVNTGGTSLTNSNLTLGNAVENFNLGGNGSAVLAAQTVSGAVTLNGTATINVSGSFAAPSTNVLMSYGSISGSGHFVAGSLPAINGFITALINDTANQQLKLVYASAGAPLQWAVGNGNWDTASLDWQPLGGGSPTAYQEYSSVTFDDSSTGSSPVTVTLTGDRTPGAINVNASKDYLITGNFAIAAGGTLTKNNSGKLTLAVNSGYTGGTVINAGNVQVGNGAAAGSLGSGNVANNGGLTFDVSGNLTVPGIISGSGNITNLGSGMVTLAGSNTYNGKTIINAGTLVTTLTSTGGGDFNAANGATLGIQANTAGSLLIGNLTLGTTPGNLTNSFVLGPLSSTSNPLVTVSTLNLNGTVTVNVGGTGLASGTYILLQYSSLTGAGTFVTGSLPIGGGWFLVNDTAAKQLKLVGVAGLVWDAGNTNNGAIIDPASGTWDLNAGNPVWNNAGVNVGFNNGNNVVFGGTNGSYNINLGASVTTPAILLQNSGYTLTASNPQVINLSGVTGALQLYLAPGTTNTIGTNITIQPSASLSYLVGQNGSTPGGTLNIINGGSVLQTQNGRTLSSGGYGTVINVYTGGSFSQISTGTGNCQLAVGSTVNVEGGTVVDNGTAVGSLLTVGSPNGAILNLDNGVVRSAGTSGGMRLTANSNDVATVNLNGGVLTAPLIFKGTNSSFAIATFNFNGGTLQANAGSVSFMNGLDAANVLTNGAVIDDGGNGITIGQRLLNGAGVDGGLTKLGAGSLTLTGANTYNGNTIISNGILALSGSGSIAGSSSIRLANGATFNVSAVAPFIFGNSQILAGNGIVNGSVQANGTLAPGYPGGTLTFNNDLTVNGNLAFQLNKSLAQSNSLIIVAGALNNNSAGTLMITNVGPGLVAGDKFTLFSQPLPNGNNITIVPPSGVTFTNLLATDGSVQVLTAPSVIATNPTNIVVSVSGNSLTLAWPADHLGWIAQSNAVDLANSNFWHDVPNSQNGTNLVITLNPAATNVFYRLRSP